MKFDDSIDDELKGWLRLDNWTPKEALLLLCGANPRVDAYPLRPLRCCAESFDPSEAFDNYERLEDSWLRGSHNIDRNTPAYYVEWAQAHGFEVWWLGEVTPDDQDEEASVLTPPPTVTTESVPIRICGDTADRLYRAIEAFPKEYPDYPSKILKLNGDVREWLRKDDKFATNSREAIVFSTILVEHFNLRRKNTGQRT